MTPVTGVRGVYYLARTLGGTRLTATRFAVAYSLEGLGYTLARTAESVACRITPKDCS